MRPLIGITTYFVKASEIGTNRQRGLPDQDMLMSTMDYSQAIELAGGIPVTVPVINNENYIEEIVEKIDGFLFAGGPDINPLKYNEHFKKGLGKIVPERDDFELRLLDKVLNKNKPVFGICRGFQIINTYFGGSLYQDIKNELATDIEHAATMGVKYSICHKVNLVKDSILNRVFKKEELYVNSFHHQAIKKLGHGLKISAKAEDGIVEGFEHKDYPFVIGVQWHPEMMFEVHSEQLELFKVFVNKVKEN